MTIKQVIGNFRIGKSEAVLRVQTLPFPPPKKVGGAEEILSFLLLIPSCPALPLCIKTPISYNPPRALLFTRWDIADQE